MNTLFGIDQLSSQKKFTRWSVCQEVLFLLTWVNIRILMTCSLFLIHIFSVPYITIYAEHSYLDTYKEHSKCSH